MPRLSPLRSFVIQRLRYLAKKGKTDTIQLEACKELRFLLSEQPPAAPSSTPETKKDKDELARKVFEASLNVGRKQQ